MATINEVIGNNLRKFRLARGMSQTEAGQALSPAVSFQQIQKFEKGVNRLACEQLFALSRAFGCTVFDLFEGVENAEGITIIVERASRKNSDLIEKIEMLSDDARAVLDTTLKALSAKFTKR